MIVWLVPGETVKDVEIKKLSFTKLSAQDKNQRENIYTPPPPRTLQF